MLTYTCLVATLVLLLGVSFAIVLRSVILRRQHGRAVANAIENGIWPTPTLGAPVARATKKDFGEKPKLFVASLATRDSEGESEDSAHGDGKQKEKERAFM